ncbi:hypothetical protein [Corticicoccus populi]|uniref:Uncharacterized protein n=1 Tax=Corticicoccus populi TaxID=1812821 RepID=A0ABW5WSW3_9STAP
MKELMNEISVVLGDDFTEELRGNPFFNYFENNQEYIYNTGVSNAVLCFNVAMNMLDFEPDGNNRENHVLSGDYLFSKFYSILSANNEFQVLHDVSKLSTEMISKKSRMIEQDKKWSKDDIKHIMFAPLLYLVENGYAHHHLTSIIDEYVNRLYDENIPYYIRNKGEFNGQSKPCT